MSQGIWGHPILSMPPGSDLTSNHKFISYSSPGLHRALPGGLPVTLAGEIPSPSPSPRFSPHHLPGSEVTSGVPLVASTGTWLLVAKESSSMCMPRACGVDCRKDLIGSRGCALAKYEMLGAHSGSHHTSPQSTEIPSVSGGDGHTGHPSWRPQMGRATSTSLPSQPSPLGFQPVLRGGWAGVNSGDSTQSHLVGIRSFEKLP